MDPLEVDEVVEQCEITQFSQSPQAVIFLLSCIKGGLYSYRK